jgi:sugar lactone lactonase YvrE
MPVATPLEARWRSIAAVVLYAATAFATTAQAQVTSIAVGGRPESITKCWDGLYCVSSTGVNTALNGPADGDIRKLDISTGTVTVFVTGLVNPRGLAFTGKYLAVADDKKIWLIEEDGSTSVLADASQFPFPITTIFNDLAPEHGGHAIYASDMGRRDLIRDASGNLLPVDSNEAWAVPLAGRVYRVGLDGKITAISAPSRKLLVLNGLTEATKGKGNRMLVVDTFHGNVVALDKHQGTMSILATAFRGADGVGQGKDGTIYVSSFDRGAVWRMDADGENITALVDNLGRGATADLYVNEDTDELYVPDFAHGMILIIPAQ